MLARTPELGPLSEKAIAIVGLGCLGGYSLLEFARAGIGEVHILDPDHVEPGTIGRWPLGMQFCGIPKVVAASEFISLNYPGTAVHSFEHRIGQTRTSYPSPSALPGRSEQEIVSELLSGVSIVYDASTEMGVQQFLSDEARQRAIPYICVSATPGGWGGKAMRIIPGTTEGCWMCFRLALQDGSIPEPPGDDDHGMVQPPGCGDVTYTGAGFDLLQVALAGVRLAVSTICSEIAGGYPSIEGDVVTITLREGAQAVHPRFDCYSLKKHPTCPTCTLRDEQ